MATKDPDYAACSKKNAKQQIVKSNRNCCVPGCTMHGYPDVPGHGKISYHNFPPVGNSLRRQWLINIRRDEDSFFKVTQDTVVCSLHFSPEHLEYHRFSGRRTKLIGCVPTIFECWKDIKHIYKENKNRPANALQKKRSDKDKIDVDGNCLPLIEGDLSEERALKSETNDMNVSVQEAEIENMLLTDNLEKLKERNKKLLRTNERLKEENNDLKLKLKQVKFSVDNVSDKDITFYTGFASRAVFNAVLAFLDPGKDGENLILNSSSSTDENQNSKSGRPRKLSPDDQFFMFLCRVKVGLFEQDLAHRFGVSISTVSNTLISWANFCYIRLGSLNIWPSKKQVLQSMPQTFKEKYPSTRVIIDCTEIKVEMSSSLLLKSQTYSNYKSTNTLKGLIGIAPSGSVCFVSQLYTGCISDKEITERSGFLKMPFDEGDSIRADKGFDIQDLLDVLNVKLNIPPFLGMLGQMAREDVMTTQSIAAERIHVERAINKIKLFHIFDQVIPLSLSGSINQIWTVCAILTLFQEPIISVT